ncbi:MerR family transcriptional regulator [Priestia koreensis]|uniref:MerR family transcriptional regulator n=1 Tax=Priestia koreensis TaxID=284581 RepID=UPI003017245A
MNEFERAYTTKEVAESLEIGQSTLRKWSIALEQSGYPFTKNDQGYRLFLDRDIEILKQFKKLVKEQSMPLENAANLIVEHMDTQLFSTRTEVALSEETVVSPPSLRNDAMDERLMEFIDKQEAFNDQLLEIIKQQQQTIKHLETYIDEKLERRDHQILSVIRESRETKKLLLEQKQQEEEQKKEKPGFFKRLFN